MLDRRWRKGVEQTLGPVGDRLRRVGVTADALTVFGLLCSVATAVLIASGHLLWAVVGVIVSGVSDLLDGAIARGSGQASPRGAFFDSVADRVVRRAAVRRRRLVPGRRSRRTTRSSRSASPRCSMMISYERARAESLGLDARGGLMERAERFVFLGVGLAFDILVPVLWIMLVLTAFTAIQRFVRVYRQAGAPAAPDARPRDRAARDAAAHVVDDAPGRGEPGQLAARVSERRRARP